nr:unnamed protein product [Digitaria exilis]
MVGSNRAAVGPWRLERKAPLLRPLPMLTGGYAIVAVALAFTLPPPAVAVPTPGPDCDASSSYAANSTFQANLNLLAEALPVSASASPAGFATATVGTAPNQANGLALCRGDTNASTCAACVAAAFRDAQQACPLDMGVTDYRDACVLRFAGSQFLDFLREDHPAVATTFGSDNASDAWFNAAVTGIFTALVDRAAATTNATRKYFATAEMDVNPKLYGLAQCTPDLTPGQCRDCLGDLQNVVTQYLSGQPISNSAFVVWCSLIYSVSPVYDGRAMLQLAAPPEPPPPAMLTLPSSGSRSAAGISAGIACSVVLMLVLSVFFYLCLKRR